MQCELCKRESDDKLYFTKHHTTPKSEGGVNLGTELLCTFCHDQIHMLIDNKTLDKEYDTIDKLMSHHGVRKFVRWIKKQPIERKVKMKISKNRKRRFG